MSVEEILSLPTLEVAKALLGCRLIHASEEGLTSGIIVETEAYLRDDPASHSFRRMTTRTAPMFDKAGTIYVYQIYGVHFCANITTNETGIGEAVLLRALQPVEGIEIMQKRRKNTDIKSLCSGPGKLVEAMGIKKTMNNWVVNESPIQLIAPAGNNPEVHITTRIGITLAKDLNYRFYLKNNPFISRK